jgi:hypothetical protein
MRHTLLETRKAGSLKTVDSSSALNNRQKSEPILNPVPSQERSDSVAFVHNDVRTIHVTN